MFIDGLRISEPNHNAPDFVKAKISIKREDLIAWLQQQKGEWINADVKVSKGGNWYAQVSEYKKMEKPESLKVAKDSKTSQGLNGEVIDVDQIPF